jgi:diguanylate cyclase (GGDEF)-like protein
MNAEKQEKTPSPDVAKGRPWPFFLLATLLGLLFLLCLFLLFRGFGLRQDLNLHLQQSDALHRLRDELAPLRPVTERRDLATPIEDWEETWRQAETHAGWEGDTHALVSMRNLVMALGSLRQATVADARWDAALAVLAAASDAEGHNQERLTLLHRSLGGTWVAVAGLAVGALLLAAAALLLAQRLRQWNGVLEAEHSKALARATHDRLTGLWNSDSIREVLHQELERSRRLQVPLGVILMDLDGFQEMSQWVGSARGDEILEQVAARLASLLRPYDTLGRLSEESFLTVLPACDAIATDAVAVRLLEAVHGQEIEHSLGKTTVTVTIAKMTIHEPAGKVASALTANLSAAIERARGDGKGPVINLDDEP